jgi:hypothetical protein
VIPVFALGAAYMRLGLRLVLRWSAELEALMIIRGALITPRSWLGLRCWRRDMLPALLLAVRLLVAAMAWRWLRAMALAFAVVVITRAAGACCSSFDSALLEASLVT